MVILRILSQERVINLCKVKQDVLGLDQSFCAKEILNIALKLDTCAHIREKSHRIYINISGK